MERDTTHAVILQGKLTARVARVLDTNSPLIWAWQREAGKEAGKAIEEAGKDIEKALKD